MKKMAAGEFKARCLAVMETVRAGIQWPSWFRRKNRPCPFWGVVKITGDIESPIW